MAANDAILVIGATGYIGSRLVPELLKRHRVRAMSRRRAALQRRFPAQEGLELVEGDLHDRKSLAAACEGCAAIYYLAHSMEPGEHDFRKAELRAAKNLASVVTGRQRVIYLGALGEAVQGRLSSHLATRQEVGSILRTGKARVTELRASIIIGTGSASFELLRRVVDRVPVIIGPGWLRRKAQPIGVEDALRCLVDALDARSGRLSLCGDEIFTYQQLLKLYARVRGVRRLIITLPFLAPILGSFWLRLLTPLPKELTRPLVASLQHDTVAQDPLATRRYGVAPRAIEEAISRALDGRGAAGSRPGDPSWVTR